jgi:hypothetical protein
MMNINITLNFIGFIKAVLTLQNHILTKEQLHTVLCVDTIAHTYFTPGRPLVVSLHDMGQESTHKQLIQTAPHRDNLLLVKFMLQKLHDTVK